MPALLLSGADSSRHYCSEKVFGCEISPYESKALFWKTHLQVPTYCQVLDGYFVLLGGSNTRLSIPYYLSITNIFFAVEFAI